MTRLFEKYPVLANLRVLIAGYLGGIVLATLHRLYRGESSYNNFRIFRWSFSHLLAGQDLYAAYPDQYLDLFKYSPTFALLMAPFWYLPMWASLLSWNLLNAAVPLWAVTRLRISPRQQAFFLWFVGLELYGSIQNAQSNGLMTGLIIGAFAAWERKQIVLASLLICVGFYVKLFAIAASVLLVFYPHRSRFLLTHICCLVLLGLAPLVVTSPAQLWEQYASWQRVLAHDPMHHMNYNVMSLMQQWFGIHWPNAVYLIPSAILLLLPLVHRGQARRLSFRLCYLGLLLVWVVIFNHKAESPTYVIALSGVALWAITETRRTLRTVLLCFVFGFTSLASTDLLPDSVQTGVWQKYSLMALPCIVVWGVITWRLLFSRNFPEIEFPPESSRSANV